MSSYLCGKETIIKWLKAAPSTNFTESLLTGLAEGSMQHPDMKLLQLLCKTIGINAIIVNVYTRGDLLTVNCEKHPYYNEVLKQLYIGAKDYYNIPGMRACGDVFTNNFMSDIKATSAFHLFHGDELKIIEAHYEVLQSY